MDSSSRKATKHQPNSNNKRESLLKKYSFNTSHSADEVNGDVQE